MSEVKVISIDGVDYVRKDQIQEPAVSTEGLVYVIVRTHSAGVHAGFLKSQDGKIVELLNSRRLWYWSGAATLSQLAVDGTSKPESCKFPVEVPAITLTEAIEVIPASSKAMTSIKAVKIWQS